MFMHYLNQIFAKRYHAHTEYVKFSQINDREFFRLDYNNLSNLPAPGGGNLPPEYWISELSTDESIATPGMALLYGDQFTLDVDSWVDIVGKAYIQSWYHTSGIRYGKVEMRLDTTVVGKRWSNAIANCVWWEQSPRFGYSALLAAGTYDIEFYWDPIASPTELYCSAGTYPNDYYAQFEVFKWPV